MSGCGETQPPTADASTRQRARAPDRASGSSGGSGRRSSWARRSGPRSGSSPRRADPMTKPAAKRVLVTDSLQGVGVEVLRGEGLSVDAIPTLPSEELIRRIGPYNGLVVRSATRVTAEVIAAAPALEVIGRAGVGLDNVDVDAATRRGIVCMNTPGGNTIAAAEHTMALLLAVARKLPQAHAHLRDGKWERERFVGVEVYGKTLGIVGLGRVGTEVARRAQGFAMTVVAYDPYLGTEIPERPGVELVDLDTLLRRSDFITVHIPLTKETRGLIGAAELERTKPGVRIVN